MNINRGDIWYIGNGYPCRWQRAASGPPRRGGLKPAEQPVRRGRGVIYLTTVPKRDLPTHVTIRSSGRVSTALCEQISTVSVERLGNYCGHVSDSELTAIENAMLISLGIQLAPVSEESEETPPCRNHGSPKSKLGAVSCRSCMTLCWTGSSRLDENIKKPHAARRAA